MRWLVDLIYLLGLAGTAPVWLFNLVRTGKYRTDWAGRFGRIGVLGSKTRPRVVIHAVSVGEVNAIRNLVVELECRPEAPEVVICTTTNTGYQRATELWHAGEKRAVVRYPFDFSGAVRRFLDAVSPDAVVLTELEVWPNFTAECRRRGIPIGVVNGRLTERSFRRYRVARRLLRPTFARLAFVAAQNQQYAERFRALGAIPQVIAVTGTMKWDTAQIADEVDGADDLAREMGIDRSKPLIVAGSTAPGEHELLLKSLPDGVQLLCAPRKPEWFDDAAMALPECVRRSMKISMPAARLFLLDTIGELRKAYALADVVVVGRSFGSLFGSDMIEPIALGKATVVGPAVSDFQDTVDALLANDGLIQTTALKLPEILRELIHAPQRRQQLAENGRSVIRQQQGATARNAGIIAAQLTLRFPKTPPSRHVAGTAVEEKEERH